MPRLLLVVALLLPAAAAAPAHAAYGPVGALSPVAAPEGCVDDSGSDGCRDIRGASAIARLSASPDGSALIVPSSSDAVVVLRRDPAGGALQQPAGSPGCVAPTGNLIGCRVARNLDGAYDAAFSPDGRHVYVAGANGIAAFDYVNDAAVGGLVQLPGASGCQSDDGTAQPGNEAGACTDGRALQNLKAIAVAPKGDLVFAAVDPPADGSDGVVVLARDAETGALSQLPGARGCVTVSRTATGDDAPASGCGGELRGAVDPTDLAVAPDGSALFVSSSQGVVSITRDETGLWRQRPEQTACVTSAAQPGCADGRALGNPFSIALSPNGRSLYVANSEVPELAFLHVSQDGGLGQSSDQTACFVGAPVSDGPGPCTGAQNVGGAQPGVAVSPDGMSVATGGSASLGEVVLFTRDPSTGQLGQLDDDRACVSRTGESSGIDGGPGQCYAAKGTGTRDFAWSPGGEHFYAGGGSSVALLRREVAPSCRETTVATDSLTPVTIAFSCADLNGDAITVQPDEYATLTKGTATLEGTSARFTPFAGASGQEWVVVRPRDASGNLGGGVRGIVDITLRTTPVAQPPLPPTGRAPLPRVRTRTLRPDRKRRMRLTLSCPVSAPVSCAGRLVVRTVKVRTSRRGKRRVVPVAALGYDIAPGKSRRLTFRATSAVRRILRARRLTGLTVRVSAPARGALLPASAVSRAQLKR